MTSDVKSKLCCALAWLALASAGSRSERRAPACRLSRAAAGDGQTATNASSAGSHDDR